MSGDDRDNTVQVRVGGESQVTSLTASITVRLSIETNRGWMTIGAKGDAVRTTSIERLAISRTKAALITDAKDIVNKCLWEADIALEKALNGELGDEVEDRRVQYTGVQGDRK